MEAKDQKKQVNMCRGVIIQLMGSFSSVTMVCRKQGNDTFTIRKPRILYPAKLSSKNESKIKIFPNK